jgi:hypothetical protein
MRTLLAALGAVLILSGSATGPYAEVWHIVLVTRRV